MKEDGIMMTADIETMIAGQGFAIMMITDLEDRIERDTMMYCISNLNCI